MWGGGVLPEKLDGDVRPAYQNDQNLRFFLSSYDHNQRISIPHLWPDQKLDTLFMTSPLNGGKMAKIDTLFMTKTAEKPYPLGPHIPV